MKTCLNPLCNVVSWLTPRPLRHLLAHILLYIATMVLWSSFLVFQSTTTAKTRIRCKGFFSVLQLAMLQLLRQIQRCQGSCHRKSVGRFRGLSTHTHVMEAALPVCMSRCKLAKGSCDMAHSPCSWKADVDHRLLGCKTVRRFQNSGSLLSLLRQDYAKGYRDVQSMLHISIETAQEVRTSLYQPAIPTPSHKFIIWFR